MIDLPNAAVQAALALDTIRPKWMAFADVVGDPMRVTTAPYTLTFAGQGDPDLDGQVFNAVDATLLSVSPIQRRETGASAVTVTLSGLNGVDTDTLDLIGNRANWQGRAFRLWAMLVDENAARIGSVWEWYSGLMSSARITGDSSNQVITITVESYLGFLAQASNRTYLDQADFDPGDQSAAATLAVANGTGGGLGSAAAGSGAGVRADYTGPLLGMQAL